MKVEGIIFDLDGVILDSMPYWETLGEDYLKTLGIKSQGNLNAILADMSLTESALYLQNKYNIKKSIKDIIYDINKLIEDNYLYEIKLKKGIKVFLQMASNKNIKMCIATASNKYLAYKALLRCGINHYFSEIFTCEDVGHGKIKPNIYQTAHEHLGTNMENTLVFEDAIYALETAKNAGFITVGVQDNSETDQKKVEEISNFYLEDFENMEAIYENSFNNCW